MIICGSAPRGLRPFPTSGLIPRCALLVRPKPSEREAGAQPGPRLARSSHLRAGRSRLGRASTRDLLVTNGKALGWTGPGGKGAWLTAREGEPRLDTCARLAHRLQSLYWL